MYSRFPLPFLCAICLLACSATMVSAQETPDTAISTTDYQAFWYKTNVLDETRVEREEMSSTEYERTRTAELTTKWVPLYTQLLMGNYGAGETYGYDPERAQLMVQMDGVTQQRLRESPTYLNEVAAQMAEWALFYEQFDLWSQYIEQSVLREPLPDDAKTEYNPATAETELPQIYEKLKEQARQVGENLYKLYRNPMAVRDSDRGLVDRIERETFLRQQYEEWLKEREKTLLAFADLWRRHYDGTEVWIEGTQYLVRNLRDVPADPEDDVMRHSLPDDAVLLEVPKGKIITPFDLIHESGELKTPDSIERSGR